MLSEKRILCIYFPALEGQLKNFPSEDIRSALAHLAQWAYRFSPITAPDSAPEDLPKKDKRFFGVNIDITGCQRLFQGERALVEKLSGALSKFRLEHRLAIAPSLGSAWALSRHGPQPIVIVHQDTFKNALLSLPIAALRISPQVEAALQELNVSEISEILRLPRKSLLERFGKRILDRLDQLHGIQHEVIHPVRIVTLSRVEKVFNGAVIDNETIKAAAWDLLGELLLKLRKRHLQPTHIAAQLKTVGGQTLLREIFVSMPTYNHKHLARMLERRLDTVRAPFGVEKLSLLANRTEQFNAERMQFLSVRSTDSHGAKQLAELLDSLIEHLGRQQILVPRAHASHIPELAFSFEPIGGGAESDQTVVPRTDRPSLLLNQPQPMRAMAALPDGPPFWLKWRNKTYEVKRAIGPERIAAEWWKEQRGRDYFKVQIPSGAWLWVYRELDSSKWFLQGMWA